MCDKKVYVKILDKELPCRRENNHGHGVCMADLTGQVIGRAKVVRFAGVNPKWKTARWVVKVGNFDEQVVSAASLIYGKNKFKQHVTGLSTTPEYKTVQGHFHHIFTDVSHRPWYKDMPFCDDWNPQKGGSFASGAKWLIENIGKKPEGKWELHIIDKKTGFVPGNLSWVPKENHKQEEMIAKLLLENQRLKRC